MGEDTQRIYLTNMIRYYAGIKGTHLSFTDSGTAQKSFYNRQKTVDKIHKLMYNPTVLEVKNLKNRINAPPMRWMSMDITWSAKSRNRFT